MTSNIDLYWFSGTGNSLFVTNQLKKKLDSLGYQCSLTPIESTKRINNMENTTIEVIVSVAMQGTFP